MVLLKDGWVVQSKNFSQYYNLGNPITTVKRLSEWASDELIYLDISRDTKYDIKRDDQNYPNRKSFLEIIQDISKVAHMPLTIGGKIKSIDDIKKRLKLGADKVSINTHGFKNLDFLKSSINLFGSQCIGSNSVDLKKLGNDYFVFINGGTENTKTKAQDWLKKLNEIGVGEVFLNFIDRDGLGNGFEIEFTNEIMKFMNIPIILCGGAGNEDHFLDAIKKTDVDAIAAANFFHFKDQSVYYTKKKLCDNNLNFRKPDIIEI